MDKSQPCDATMSIAGIHYSMCLHTALCVWVRACVRVCLWLRGRGVHIMTGDFFSGG